MSFRFITYMDMRRAAIVFCLVGITVLLSAAIACGQVAVVITNAGATVIDRSGSVQTVSGKHLIDLRSPTPDPGPDPQPPPGPADLSAKVSAWAAQVGEPSVSQTLAAFYRQFAAAMGNGATWAQVQSGIQESRRLVLNGSNRKTEWQGVFAKIDAELTNAPKTVATLSQLAKGYEQASAIGTSIPDAEKISWIKLIGCIPCIVAAFTDTATDDAKPKPIPMPGVSSEVESPPKPTIAGDINKVYPQIQLHTKPQSVVRSR